MSEIIKKVKTLSFPNDNNIYKIAPDAEDVDGLKEITDTIEESIEKIQTDIDNLEHTIEESVEKIQIDIDNLEQITALRVIQVNNTEELKKAIVEAVSDTTIKLRQNDINNPYDLLELTSKEKAGTTNHENAISFPKNLTLEGEGNVYLAGISITSGVLDGDIQTPYPNTEKYEAANADISNAILSSGLTIKNIIFTNGFSLRNASIDNLSLIKCTFNEGSFINITPNAMNDCYGGDYKQETHAFETRHTYMKLTPRNLLIRECTFKNASGNNQHKDGNSAIYVNGVKDIVIYKNIIHGAARNGINVSGNDAWEVFSEGKISITNNTIENTGSRSIRLLTIRNATVDVIYNALRNANITDANNESIKANNFITNTTFNWSNNTYNGASISVSNGGIFADYTGPEVDYIIAEGNINGWTYRKWVSGIAECWGNFSTINHSAWSDTTAAMQVWFPFPFTGIPTITVSGYQNNLAGAYISYTKAEVDYVTSYMIGTGTVGTGQECYFNFHAIGKWK